MGNGPDLLTVKEAARIVGVSGPFLSTILRPKFKEKSITGGSARLMYVRSDVEAFALEYLEKKKLKTKKKIEQEKDGVEHPGPAYLTLTEASELTGLKKIDILAKTTSKTLKTGKGELRTFFRETDVIALLVQGKNTKKKRPPKKSGVNPEDPFGVMIKPKVQGRKCPVCGATLLEGQYLCKECTIKRDARVQAVDAEEAYGSVGFH